MHKFFNVQSNHQSLIIFTATKGTPVTKKICYKISKYNKLLITCIILN